MTTTIREGTIDSIPDSILISDNLIMRQQNLRVANPRKK